MQYQLGPISMYFTIDSDEQFDYEDTVETTIKQRTKKKLHTSEPSDKRSQKQDYSEARKLKRQEY